MIRLGAVGLGWWGRELAAAAQSLAPRFALAACFSPDAEERRAFAARFGARALASYEALLERPDVDAVVLATPHSLHGREIEAAARARKHVFVEKPLTLGVAEGHRALAACRKAGVVLAVGHNRRLLAGPRLVRDWIAQGTLGTILHVEANFSTREGALLPPGHWRRKRSESLGGPLAPLGIHMIDWFHWLFGRVERVSAIVQRRVPRSGIDDTAAVLLRFEAGMTGYLGCLYRTPYTSELAVYGTAAKAVLRAREPDGPAARPVLLLEPVEAPPQAIAVPFVDALTLELERFADAIEGKGEVAVGGAEALDNVALMAAILASAAKRGRPEVPCYPK